MLTLHRHGPKDRLTPFHCTGQVDSASLRVGEHRGSSNDAGVALCEYTSRTSDANNTDQFNNIDEFTENASGTAAFVASWVAQSAAGVGGAERESFD